MEKHALYNLMYPIGKFESPPEITQDNIREWMWTIEEFPTVIWGKIKDLGPKELQWRYRPNGWTITQVIHHLADSHMNAYCRFKLALTEDFPKIKPYHEGKWAELPDYDPNLNHLAFNLIEAVHGKWHRLLSNMGDMDWIEKGFFHPESGKTHRLGEILGLYDWHCRHHREHISQAISFEGRYY